MTQITGVFLQLPTGSITDQTIAGTAALDPTKMAQRPLQKFTIPWSAFRVWDAYASLPPSTAGTDDLALTTGTWLTNAARITAGDVKTLSGTRYAIVFVPVPDNYQDGETVTLRIRAGMATTIASSVCTIDAEAIVRNGSGVASADLVTTAAQSMNSLTPADFDFQLNPSLLDPGMLLEIRLAIAYTDVATATAVTPTIYGVDLLVDTRG
jgi:hypothetical protein